MAEEAVVFRVPQSVAAAVRRFARGESGVDITIEPTAASDQFSVRIHESEKPVQHFSAKLLALPTCLEVHKTRDYARLVKAGMISRMLWVYDPADLKAQSTDIVMDPGSGASSEGDATNVPFKLVQDPTPGSVELTVDSGLTPPMQHATQLRFRRAHRFISKHDTRLISEAEQVLLDLMVHDTYEHVVEEFVEAEAFMEPWFRGGGDNVTIRYEDGKERTWELSGLERAC
jgi:TATA-binding protein-associated factor Taf7